MSAMQTITPPTEQPPQPESAVCIRPITVDEYHRMVEAGILYEGEPVELLDGQLIAMPPEGPVHSGTISMLLVELVQRFAGRAIVRPGNSMRLNPLSEPEPDFTLVRPREDWYLGALPSPEDVLLLIEVSLSTLGFDRRTKMRAYAKAGIAEFWIVDLVHRRVEVHTEPHEDGYGNSRVVERDGSVAPRAFPDDAIPVASFLP